MRPFKTHIFWLGSLMTVASSLSACEGECTDCLRDPPPEEESKSPSQDDSDASTPETQLDASITPDAAADASSVPRSDAETPLGDASTSDSGSITDADTPDLPAFPSDLLNLRNWKLTIPLETEWSGNPDEYKTTELQDLTLAPYFGLSPTKDAVIFRAHAGGATTPNSRYPRTELREMWSAGSEPAAWSTSSGTHRMKVRQAITHLPSVKPHVVSAQIHDSADDVVMIRLEKTHLYVEGNGERLGTLESNYELGTIFTVELVASNGTIEVLYNGSKSVTLKRAATGCYFKAGCYLQSNVQRGDAPDAYAQVEIYELVVTHE